MAFVNSKDLKPKDRRSAENIAYIRRVLNNERQALLDEINVNHLI